MILPASASLLTSARPSPDGRIKVEPPLRIVLLLQRPQPLKPPRLVPIHLLERLVAVRVVDVGVVLGGAASVSENVADALAVGNRQGVEGGVGEVGYYGGAGVGGVRWRVCD